jgi:hypothetical protein
LLELAAAVVTRTDQSQRTPARCTSFKQVGDIDHLKVFANADAAETWLEENDPEGVAFEYAVLE